MSFRPFEGLGPIRVADSGPIRELTVMVRPRSALEALLGGVGPRLAKLGSA